MIISHDSFTFDKPSNILLNLIKIFWKCQSLTIKQQYECGVRVFDVRVKRYKNRWYGGHGIYRAKYESFDTLDSLCKYFKYSYPDSYIRIYLEDKSESSKEIFLKEAKYVFIEHNNMIWEIGTHFPWQTYYKNDHLPFTEIKEYYCHLFNWNPDKSIWHNIKHFDCSSWSLPLYSKKHNIQITEEMKNDKIGYMFDYIGIYPK